MKRILLLVTVASMLAAALALSGVAQAQEPCDFVFCIDKTVDKDTVEVGQQITFTITQRCPPANSFCFTNRNIVDVLPSGLTDVTVEDNYSSVECSTTGNTVTCSGARSITQANPFTATIVATTTQCGTFTNTASDTVRTGQATFTVEGCPTLPTTKDECKKGGWRGLGWPDQGTCITAFNENRP
jgi:uncharacterized repeat protein (TIGR01451 family)